MVRFRDIRAQGPQYDQPMEVLVRGDCPCGGTYMVTQTSGETRSRVRHSGGACEYFDKLPAPAYLQALRERAKLLKGENGDGAEADAAEPVESDQPEADAEPEEPEP